MNRHSARVTGSIAPSEESSDTDDGRRSRPQLPQQLPRQASSQTLQSGRRPQPSAGPTHRPRQARESRSSSGSGSSSEEEQQQPRLQSRIPLPSYGPASVAHSLTGAISPAPQDHNAYTRPPPWQAMPVQQPYQQPSLHQQQSIQRHMTPAVQSDRMLAVLQQQRLASPLSPSGAPAPFINPYRPPSASQYPITLYNQAAPPQSSVSLQNQQQTRPTASLERSLETLQASLDAMNDRLTRLERRSYSTGLLHSLQTSVNRLLLWLNLRQPDQLQVARTQTVNEILWAIWNKCRDAFFLVAIAAFLLRWRTGRPILQVVNDGLFRFLLNRRRAGRRLVGDAAAV